MKTNTLIAILVIGILPAQADESDYRTNVKATRERFQSLDLAYNDYRKSKPGLPHDQEEERLRLFGKLVTDDPVWALIVQIQADIDAVNAISPQSPADRVLLENLKDILSITSALDGRATTQLQAENWATGLRQFIARRDVRGAQVWAESR
jgi:hypothetical protein